MGKFLYVDGNGRKVVVEMVEDLGDNAIVKFVSALVPTKGRKFARKEVSKKDLVPFTYSIVKEDDSL